MSTARAVAPWAALLVLFASAVSFFAYQGWTTSAGPVLISDDVPSLSRFVESKVGQVTMPDQKRSGNCRRILFSNDTGLMRDLGAVSCHEPVQSSGQSGAGGNDRLDAMRGAFKK